MPLRQALISSLVVVAVLLGGCAPVLHKPHAAGSTNPYEDTAHPMSDDQTKAQVIEPAKQIVAAAKLEESAGHSPSPRATTKGIRRFRAPSR